RPHRGAKMPGQAGPQPGPGRRSVRARQRVGERGDDPRLIPGSPGGGGFRPRRGAADGPGPRADLRALGQPIRIANRDSPGDLQSTVGLDTTQGLMHRIFAGMATWAAIFMVGEGALGVLTKRVAPSLVGWHLVFGVFVGIYVSILQVM